MKYLAREALPDWKHKLARVKQECCQFGIVIDPQVAQRGAEKQFAKWFSTLRDEVIEWKRSTEAVEIPRFDQAVEDFKALQDRQEVPRMKATQPGMRPNGEGMAKIEKVDSGVEF